MGTTEKDWDRRDDEIQRDGRIVLGSYSISRKEIELLAQYRHARVRGEWQGQEDE